LLMSLTNTAWQLYLFYVVILGIGMSGCYVPLMSTVAKWFVKRRSVMTGLVVAGGGIGAIITPPLVNWLIATFGWRNAYLIMGAFVLVLIMAAAQFLRRDPAQMGQVAYGGNKVGEQRLDLGTQGLSLKEAAFTRQLWMELTMSFCFGVCVSTIAVHLVPHATDLGISAATAANIMAVRGVTGLLGGIALGSTADRIGIRQAYVITFILMAAALFWLLTAGEAWTLYLCALILGFGGGGAATLASPLAAELFGLGSHGLILGVVGLCYTIGAAVGPFMAGYIFDVTGSYQLAFLVCAAAGIIGTILAAILRPIKN
jgi:MFS family permease